ncbi:MAG: outer membrane protein assembly factor BamD [Pirellulales bacterium]|nr:outer membrane protein assembly factor BamD [Pirellulales bacterium]
MSTKGLQGFVLLMGALALAAGCAGVPPVPSHVNTRPAGAQSSTHGYDADSDDGWLFNRLTGRTAAADPPPAPTGPASRPDSGPAGVPPGVVPASAIEPIRPADSGALAAAADWADETDAQEKSGFQWSDLAPENIAAGVKKAAGYGPNEALARAKLDEGKRLFEQKQYAEAVKRFETAASRWPDSVLEEDALFLLGESHFFADRYPKAQDTYENLLKKYANSRHLDTVGKRLFAIGQYWEQRHEAEPHWPITPNLTDKERPLFDTFGNALKAYETLRLNDPTGPLADDSIMATANAYFRKGRFEDAAFHYDILRKEYPKSEHQAKAHLLGLRSKLKVYQGAAYDKTPLREADQIAEQAMAQFRRELGPEQARLAATRNEVQEEMAQRDGLMGQFYEKKKQFGAARFYYQSILDEYPTTQQAERARARLDAIRDEPDNPPKRFGWLTDLFPAEDE